jgi:hypothetical protein
MGSSAAWQSAAMDIVVLVVLTLCLVGIVAALLMTVGVALNRRVKD